MVFALNALAEIDFADDAALLPCYEENPIYIPVLKGAVTAGHFVFVSGIDAAGQSREFIGQIIKRNDCNDHTIRLCCLLPFYSIDTKEYIGSPEIYPRSVIHISCHNVVELVNISKIVDVDVNDVTGLGFVFLESDVTDLKYHIQGMTNAFIIRYKYCPETRDLLPLSPTTFQCFPDLNATYNNLWCECLGRTIFMSIDYLRQEVWRFLCRYGQSQGRFPKAYLRIPCNPQFAAYMTSFFVRAGILSYPTVASDLQRRIQHQLSYKMVSVEVNYNVFCFDCETKLETFAAMLGDTALFGVRRKRPRKDEQSETRINDAINMLVTLQKFIHTANDCNIKSGTWVAMPLLFLIFLCFVTIIIQMCFCHI